MVHDEDHFIPGIYNYCDRWCERCEYTSYCRTFERTSAITGEAEDDQVFWHTVSTNFERAMEMLHDAAVENGLDLDAIREEDTVAQDDRQHQPLNMLEQHPLHVLCKEYAHQSLTLLTTRIIEDRSEELAGQYEMGMQTAEQLRKQGLLLKECMEVINWYNYFISAKFNRALHSNLSIGDWQEENNFPKDSDGSAKVALIAVDRSLKAWVQLYNLLPAAEDAILRLLVMLEKIKHLGEATFPNAHNFIRPGFDTHQLVVNKS